MKIKLIYKADEAGLNAALSALGDVEIIDVKPFGTYSDKTSALVLYEPKKKKKK